LFQSTLVWLFLPNYKIAKKCPLFRLSQYGNPNCTLTRSILLCAGPVIARHDCGNLLRDSRASLNIHQFVWQPTPTLACVVMVLEASAANIRTTVRVN